jgi:RNA polymerase sigma-70 factor (ECF subfamily)
MEKGDADLLARLLAQDVKVTMPPEPTWFIGRDTVLAITAEVFDPDSEWFHGDWRGIPLRANRQPAVAFYVRSPGDTVFRGQLIEVFDIHHGVVTEITGFHPRLFPTFSLPETLES